MRVRCKKNRSSGIKHALTIGADYEVVGIECDDFRILDDRGDPVLIERTLFRVLDRTRPQSWVTKTMDGAEYSYAPPFGKPGFWEDYHDNVPGARRAFNRYLNEHLRLTEAA
jgi:hypothetical protein